MTQHIVEIEETVRLTDVEATPFRLPSGCLTCVAERIPVSYILGMGTSDAIRAN